ncbi:MAG: hypothetical protein V2A73_18980 [Pseudomonadota bacterium]
MTVGGIPTSDAASPASQSLAFLRVVDFLGVSRSVNGLAVLGPLSFVPSSLFNSDDEENKELETRNQELEQPPPVRLTPE